MPNLPTIILTATLPHGEAYLFEIQLIASYHPDGTLSDRNIEAEGNDDQLFDVERLIDSLRRDTASPETLLENMENDARFFADKRTFEEDVCLLAVRWSDSASVVALKR